MGSRFMDYPSPSGVHVPETYYSNDPDDPYRRPPPSRRNRYSRSVHQTPRVRDVTWISSPDPTPQAPHAPPSPWQPPAQVPPSPMLRPPSAIPSPAPTVGEHMTVEELVDIMDPYPRPQRPGLVKSFWKGLKKLSGFQSGPSFPIPRPSSYGSQAVEMPVPGLGAPSEATQYADPTSSGTGTGTERRSATPYTSPYVRPANVGATPAMIPGSLRASPVPIPSLEIPPPITVVSPSISPSIAPSPRRSSFRSGRVASPGLAPPKLTMGTPEPAIATEEGSQTLHEHVYPDPALPPVIHAPIPVARSDDSKFALPPSGGGGIQAPAEVERSSSKGSLASTMARFRRFVADLDGLPWVSDTQIADEYVPDMNPRSRLRTRVRQGAEPSWYNPRPEVAERKEYWSEWDMWAKQSTAALWDANGAGPAGWAGVGAGGQGPWGVVHPHGYVPAQPGFVYPSGYPPLGMVDEDRAPVLP